MATITGRQHHRQAVFNGFLPDDNQPLIVPIDYDFTILPPIGYLDSDFTLGMMDQILPFVQSCFVDNSANAAQLSIYIPVTNWTLKIPAHWQGTFPIYMAPGAFKPRLTTVQAPIVVRVNWCNFQQPLSGWAAT